MSPRASSSTPSSSTARSATAPYRRSAAQPKSTRQQFSACGACRMRRVRCDLKDLNFIVAGPTPSCSNCKERGIKCVDEFADVKAVKLLRRGRRLQQVEAIYGKTADGSDAPNVARNKPIPALHPDFFYSQFWRWFCIQRPILDAAEFSSRFLAHHQGDTPLCPEAGIITVLLVVWAFTFGLDERGAPSDPEPDDNDGEPSQVYIQRRHECVEAAQAMVQQILELIDLHGVMRRPSLDGVRVLLLLLPLMEDAKPLERQAIHDAALQHVQALCTTNPSPAAAPSLAHATPHTFDDATVRARLFWYAFTQEGLVSGIRGSRFVLSTDDYEAFQRTVPPNYEYGQGSPPSPPPALLSPEGQQYTRLINASTLPSHLNLTCRKIHNVLTGPKAQRRAEEHNLIDAHGMREVWNDLDRFWREFDTIRRSAATNDDPASRCDTERYACAWLIFIFECYNVIRESLKHYSTMPHSSSPYSNGSSSRPTSVSSASPYVSPQYLHSVATRKCIELLPKVIRIMKYCINNPRDSARSGLFVWDSGLVRDGCFFAGYLAASADEDVLDPPLDMQQSEGGDSESSGRRLSTDEGVMICLNALSAMRWCNSKSEEREGTIRMVWEAQKAKRHGQSAHYPEMDFDATYPHANGHSSAHLQPAMQPTHRGALPTPTAYLDGPVLPNLHVFSQLRRAESAPSTAATTDGQGAHGWPTYTPPGTATSITTATSTGLSVRGSPDFSSGLPTSYKPQGDEGYYHGGGDLDHFTYNVPITTPHSTDITPAISNFAQRHSSMDGHAIPSAAHGANYISPHFSSGGGPIVASGNDYASCPQFGDNCNAPYH